jgi:hypothetical protein
MDLTGDLSQNAQPANDSLVGSRKIIIQTIIFRAQPTSRTSRIR